MISGFLEKNWKITKWVALGAVIFEVKQDSALCCELLTARKVCLHFLSSYLTAAARSFSFEASYDFNYINFLWEIRL